jgi:2,3-bisphosphoglycerate-independent phosphoglycerate mutase
MNFNRIKNLLQPADSKIELLVMDGLGGLPKGLGHGTELETAKTPNLDDLTKQSLCGLHQPVGPAVTPGSGPPHLALFGYDPLEYEVGRGVLAALGIGFDLKSGDVAARGNFFTLDETGRVRDRRAGRISTDKNEVLCEKLRHVEVDGVRLFIQTVKEYRFLLVLRGEGLNGEIEGTVPVIFHSAYCRPDHVEHFGERACTTGGLGPRFPAKDLMPLALANAGRLWKFGA